MTTYAPQRMRVLRGRVMHVVVVRGDWYQSACHKPSGIKGVSATRPRVWPAPADDWTADNPLDYPDCKHCPVEVSA